MAKIAEEETAEFPITADEFNAGISNAQVEMKRAFIAQMKAAKETNRKTRSEWTVLYDLFRNKPVGMAWGTWVEKKQGGK